MLNEIPLLRYTLNTHSVQCIRNSIVYIEVFMNGYGKKLETDDKGRIKKRSINFVL